MNKNKEHVFFTSECLPLDAIMRYLNEQSSSKEMHMVEKHMLECALCKEAVEGYALMERKEKAAEIIKEINSGVGGKQEYVFDYRRIAAGIAAVFVLGGGLYYLSDNLKTVNDRVAIQEEKLPADPNKNNEAAEPGEKDSKEIIALDRTRIEVPGAEKSQEFLPPKVMEDEKVVEGYSINENEVLNPEPPAQAELKTKKEEQRELAAPEDKDAILFKENANGTSTAPVSAGPAEEDDQALSEVVISQRKQESKVSAKKKSRAVETQPSPSGDYKMDKADSEKPVGNKLSPMENAMDNYSKKKYSDASILFEQILKAEPSNSKALYYNGLSYFESTNWDKAIENFNKVKKGQEFYEEARWNKALALIKKADKDGAKILFKDISEEESPYKQKALEELKKLN